MTDNITQYGQETETSALDYPGNSPCCLSVRVLEGAVLAAIIERHQWSLSSVKSEGYKTNPHPQNLPIRAIVAQLL